MRRIIQMKNIVDYKFARTLPSRAQVFANFLLHKQIWKGLAINASADHCPVSIDLCKSARRSPYIPRSNEPRTDSERLPTRDFEKNFSVGPKVSRMCRITRTQSNEVLKTKRSVAKCVPCPTKSKAPSYKKFAKTTSRLHQIFARLGQNPLLSM